MESALDQLDSAFCVPLPICKSIPKVNHALAAESNTQFCCDAEDAHRSRSHSERSADDDVRRGRGRYFPVKSFAQCHQTESWISSEAKWRLLLRDIMMSERVQDQWRSTFEVYFPARPTAHSQHMYLDFQVDMHVSHGFLIKCKVC